MCVWSTWGGGCACFLCLAHLHTFARAFTRARALSQYRTYARSCRAVIADAHASALFSLCVERALLECEVVCVVFLFCVALEWYWISIFALFLWWSILMFSLCYQIRTHYTSRQMLLSFRNM